MLLTHPPRACPPPHHTTPHNAASIAPTRAEFESCLFKKEIESCKHGLKKGKETTLNLLLSRKAQTALPSHCPAPTCARPQPYWPSGMVTLPVPSVASQSTSGQEVGAAWICQPLQPVLRHSGGDWLLWLRGAGMESRSRMVRCMLKLYT